MKSLIEEQADEAYRQRRELRRFDNTPRAAVQNPVPLHPTLTCNQCGRPALLDQSKPWSKYCPDRYTRGCDGRVEESA
jgi:hypothetical protein